MWISHQVHFNEICELAKFVCKTDFAWIAIPNDNEVLIKSPIGIQLDSVLKEHSFCQYTMNVPDFLEIDDTLKDERFENNPYVKGNPNIRYYLGIRLRNNNGTSIGALCVTSITPKKSTDEQISMLLKLAKQVELLVNKIQIEQDLLKSNEKFRAVADLSPDIISIIDKNGVLVFNSSAAENIHGYKNEEIQNHNTFDFIHPDHLMLVMSEVEKLYNDPTYISYVQYQYRNKDGSYVWMEATGVNQLNNPLVEGLITISRKIEDRKKLELELQLLNSDLNQQVKQRAEQLLNIEKAAFIGSHTAEIVHNLNNPLSILNGVVSILAKKYPQEPTVGMAQHAIHNIMDIVKSILIVSRNSMSNSYSKIDLNEIILTELKLFTVDHFVKYKIETSTNLTTIPTIKGIPSHFSQCISNLIKNAVDAMYDTDVKQLNISSEFIDDAIVIKIHDTGCGILPENLSKIYEPFFSTKAKVSKGVEPTGTGLGLASVKRMLESYGAEVRIDSKVNKGTTFTLLFKKIA